MIDRQSDGSGAGPEATTRRGFLFGLLGSLAAAAGLASAWRPSESADAPRPTAPPAGPIDNIFEPIQPGDLKPSRFKP